MNLTYYLIESRLPELEELDLEKALTTQEANPLSYSYYYGVMNKYLNHHAYFKALMAAKLAQHTNGNRINIILNYHLATLAFYQQDWQQAKKNTQELLTNIILTNPAASFNLQLNRYNRLMIAALLIFSSIDIMQQHNLKAILPSQFTITKNQEEKIYQYYYYYRCTSFFPDNPNFSALSENETYFKAFADLPSKAKELLCGLDALQKSLASSRLATPVKKRALDYLNAIHSLSVTELFHLLDNDILIMFSENEVTVAKKHLTDSLRSFKDLTIKTSKWDRQNHEFIFTTNHGQYRVRGFDGRIMEE